MDALVEANSPSLAEEIAEALSIFDDVD